jgi:hypothetical protein
MNSNSREIQQSVIAILKADKKLKAVEVLKENGTYRIIWAKSSRENDLAWQGFAAGCILPAKVTSQEQITSNKNVVVGYDSTGTAFYRVNVPAVQEKEVSAIVNLQAESRFPLPADQMELAWRTNKLPNNQMAITIAAARKHPVQEFIDKVKFLCPVRAILDSEAIVKVWKELFSGQERNAVIINAGTHNTQICLAENGLLCNAVTLDIGTVDFRKSESQEDTETINRLVQDTRSAVDLFNIEKQLEVPVIVLSDGSKMYEMLAVSLKAAGLNARASTPSIRKLKLENKLDLTEIFEYRAPIGLALMAFDGKNDELNLFTYLLKPFGEKVKKHWIYRPKITGAIAGVLLLLFAAVSYAVVAAGSKVINEKLRSLDSENDIKILIEKQNLHREIAKQRAELLALLTEVTQSGQGNLNSASNQMRSPPQRPGPQPGPPGQGGIQLETFHFKRGQRVTITGQVQNKEQLENFEENLMNNRDIKDVYLTAKPNTTSTGNRNQGGNRGSGNSTRDNIPQVRGPGGPGGSGKKGFTFTITFHYKNFTGSKNR